MPASSVAPDRGINYSEYMTDVAVPKRLSCGDRHALAIAIILLPGLVVVLVLSIVLFAPPLCLCGYIHTLLFLLPNCCLSSLLNNSLSD